MHDRQGADTAEILRGAETIDLQEEGSHGVLLLHGFGDTPQTLALLARRLRKTGYSLLAPLLPGHGRNLEEFGKSRASEWIAAAKAALAKSRRSTIILAFSLATALLLGAVAAWTAACAGGRHRDGAPLPEWMAHSDRFARKRLVIR